MEVSVRVEKAEQQPLGIALRNLQIPPHCLVAHLAPEGAAASSNQVNEGDLLLSVNGQDVQLLSPDEVRKLLAAHSSDPFITLGLRRPAMNGNQFNGPGNAPPELTVHGGTPESSPKAERKVKARRTGAFTQGGKLPKIHEYSTTPNFPNLDLPPEKRLSLTPDLPRRSPMPLTTSKSLDLSNLPQWRQASKMVPLQNLLDSTELHDRLHNQHFKFKDTGCHPTHCLGSHMWPRDHRSKRTGGEPRPKEEMLPLAEDFIKQYYDSRKHALGNNYDTQLQSRLGEVRTQIEEKGHYDLTYEELVFGARTAWRNAPRCVNRIVWRQLEILDAREANTAKDMFEAICHHINYGNNGGNLRSTITIFRHRTKPKSDFRVWNSQLIRYAGYKKDDGSTLGDPANLEFTEVCMRLGWHPPESRGEYDVLPLVLQAQGGEAQLFNVPKELIIEVELQHPQHPWFKELGLRWYALPAVSNMMLDVGGLEFTGIPFNGWYMGTEIARDLGDVSRYNKLKPIAQGMGLNIQTDRLWKDQAAILLNSAVLYSFQKSNVSIVDHHSATESFMTHMKAETQSRGGCPADWVWIVPPISGSLTPVFHQEMLLYHLTPSYEYQGDPWKNYHFPDQERTRSRSGSIKFKTVANIIRRTTGIFQNVYQKRVKATIVFATETGRSKNYANIVKDVFGRVFAAKVICMDEYNKANLDHEQLLIVVTSTFGSGDPPANGETFGRYLLDLRNGFVVPGVAPTPPARRQRMSTVVAPSLDQLEGSKDLDRPLTQVKYAVFGLGSRAYPNFCTFAHTCDNLLHDLGAEQMYPCGEGDELCGQEESFQSWLRDCYLQACDIYKLDPRMEEGEISGFKTAYTKEGYRIVRYSGPVPEKNICRDLSKVHNKDVFPAVLKSRNKLQSPSSERSTILVVLDTTDTRLHYVPGDHVAIYPQNSSKLVGELLDRLALPCDPDEPVFLESRRESKSTGVNWMEERRMPVPVTLREAFTNYLDITNPPTPSFLKLLAQQASKAADRESIQELAKGGNMYEDWKYERFPNLIDVMNQFHSLKIPVTLILQELPLLQCRYYSISSSPMVFPNEVHATVAVVSFRKRGGQGPRHNGVCSTWLNRMELRTTVPCFIRRAPSFHLPDDPRTPVVMVGPGTGLAPFRSFWQDRMYKRNEALKSQLFTPSQKHKLSVDKPSPPKPKKRQRRSTTWVKPNPIMLEPVKAEEKSLTPLPIRRSASDAGVSEDIAKILAEKRKAWGSMSLYFGCRCSTLDHIYKEEMKKAKVSGALTEVHVGLSREPGQPKTYVQHLLKKNADSIVHQLMEERGHFYVCGDISMAADVSRTLQGIFEDNAAMTSDEARRMIDNMKDSGFYHEDIFGVTLKTAEVTTRVRTAAKKAYRVLVSGESALTPGTPLTLPRSLGSSRPLSPRPVSPHPLGQTGHPLAFESHPRQTMPTIKRPTVTVLNQTTSSQTTTKSMEPKQFRQSLPVFDGSNAMQKPQPLVAQKEGMQLLSLQEQPKLVILESQETTKEAIPRVQPRDTPREAPPRDMPREVAPRDMPREVAPGDTPKKAPPRSSPIAKRKGTIAALCTPPKPQPQLVEMHKRKKARAIRTRSLVQTDV